MVINVKRDWFYIFLKNEETGEEQKIASIRSPGLAYVVLEKLKETYPGCTVRKLASGWKIVWDGGAKYTW